MWQEFFSGSKSRMITEDEALPGRSTPLDPGDRHRVLGHSMQPPFPDHCRTLVLGMGCFWGAEQCFWTLPGVWTTAVGYAGGFTPNPLYEEVCSGRTGHTEVVLVVYDPREQPLERLLQVFWESHDPTQGMAQGNDRGTQYRSALYLPDGESLAIARDSARHFQEALDQAGKGSITTEIRQDVPFYYAEDYHQQYLDKNPNGYCGLAGTGVTCPAP